MVWGKIKLSETKFRLASFLYFRLRKIFGLKSFLQRHYFFTFIYTSWKKRDKANIVHLWHMNKHDVQDQGIYADMPVWIKIVKRQRHYQNESRRTRYLAMIYTSHCARRKDEKCDILCRWYWISSLSKFFPYRVIHYIS